MTGQIISLRSGLPVVLATSSGSTVKVSSDTLETISLVFLVLAIAFAAVAVFQFFYFRIPDVYSFLSGKARNKKVREMQEKNEQTGKLRDEHYTRTTSDTLGTKQERKHPVVTPPGEGSEPTGPKKQAGTPAGSGPGRTAQNTGSAAGSGQNRTSQGSVQAPFTGSRQQAAGTSGGQQYTGAEPTYPVNGSASQSARRRTEDLSYAGIPGSGPGAGTAPADDGTVLLYTGAEETTLLDSGTAETTLLDAGEQETALLAGTNTGPAGSTSDAAGGPAETGPGGGTAPQTRAGTVGEIRQDVTQTAGDAGTAGGSPPQGQQAQPVPDEAADAGKAPTVQLHPLESQPDTSEGDESLAQAPPVEIAGVQVYDQYGELLRTDAEPGQTVLLTPELAQAMFTQTQSAPPAHRFDIVKEQIEVHTEERID